MSATSRTFLAQTSNHGYNIDSIGGIQDEVIKVKGRKSVSFATYVEEYIIEPALASEGMNLWDSSKDKLQYRRQIGQDAKSTMRSLSGTLLPSDSFSIDDLIKCIGIEQFLHPEIAHQKKEMKKYHVYAVLTEQSRQQSLGIYDEERLANISDAISEWSRQNAHSLAVGYRDIFSDWNNT